MKQEEMKIAGYDYSEWEAIEKQFKKDFERSNKCFRPFRDIISEVLEGETYMSFELKTGLSQNQFYRLTKLVDVNDPPRRSTIISVAIGYNLDLMTTQGMLRSLGLDFNRFNQRDYAYSFLLTRCRGKSVDECNEILKELGIEEKHWLGKYARRKTTQKTTE